MTNRKTPRKYFLMYFAFALSVSLMQCSKTAVDPIGLPPETQTGAGIFACKINGVVWQYKDPNYEVLSTKPKTRWEYDPTLFGGLLYISGIRYSDGITADDILNIDVDSINYKNEFKFGSASYWGLVYYNHKYSRATCEEISSVSDSTNSKNFFSSGNLVITKFDKVAKILSGRFNCIIFKPTCSDTLNISEGRFDIKYR